MFFSDYDPGSTDQCYFYLFILIYHDKSIKVKTESKIHPFVPRECTIISPRIL